MKDHDLVGKLTFINGDVQEHTDTAEFLMAIKEELPYNPTTGLKIEVLTDDPHTRKAVDDIRYDLYGEENPRQLEDYMVTGAV